MDYQTAVKQIKAGQLAPVYLLGGEEKHLIETLLALLKETVLDPAVGDFNYDLLDGETATAEAIIAAANTLPVFAERRLVIVKNTGLFGPKGKGSQDNEGRADADTIISAYISNPNPTTVLVLVAEGTPDRRRKLFKLIDQRGGVVDLASFKGKALADWVEQRVKEQGQTIKRDALQYLVNLEGADLSQLTQEIAKAGLYVGEGRPIDLAAVQELSPIVNENKVFAVVDAVMQKRAAAAIDMVRRMLAGGEQPTRVFYLLVRQFRLLAQVKSMTERNLSEREMMSQLSGVSPYAVGKCRQQAGNFSWPELATAFQLCRDVDLALKSSGGEPAMLLEMLILKLCS